MGLSRRTSLPYCLSRRFRLTPVTRRASLLSVQIHPPSARILPTVAVLGCVLYWRRNDGDISSDASLPAPASTTYQPVPRSTLRTNGGAGGECAARPAALRAARTAPGPRLAYPAPALLRRIDPAPRTRRDRRA